MTNGVTSSKAAAGPGAEGEVRLLERIQEYARRNSELQAMLAVLARVNAGVTLDEVLNHLYESFQVLIPYDRMGCALIDAESGNVTSIWARSRAAELRMGPGHSAPLAGSSLAEIVASGRPRILNDLRQYLEDHPASGSTRLIVAEGIRSSLTCPLVAVGRAIGFLFFSSNEPGTYTGAHTAVYQEIASLVSLLVEKSRTHDELLETKERLVTANAALAHAAYFDALTGAPGRRYFDLLFEREWKLAARHGEILSVLVIDIDHFKQYNDTYGHPGGDRCLQQVAQSLLGGVKRGTDVVARIGGEEFAALLPRTAAPQAISVAEHLRRGVESLAIPHAGSPVAPHVTISVGVAGCVPPREDRDDPGALIRAADAALYRSKQAGRNRVSAAD